MRSGLPCTLSGGCSCIISQKSRKVITAVLSCNCPSLTFTKAIIRVLCCLGGSCSSEPLCQLCRRASGSGSAGACKNVGVTLLSAEVYWMQNCLPWNLKNCTKPKALKYCVKYTNFFYPTRLSEENFAQYLSMVVIGCIRWKMDGGKLARWR